MSTWILQLLVAAIFFAQKVFILAEKKVGWLVGVVAAVLAIFYFYLVGFYVYTVVEVGLIVLMGYGFFAKVKSSKVEIRIRLVITAVMTLLAIFAFGGALTIVELISSVLLLAGTYLLTHSRVRLGWGVSMGAHLLGWWLGLSRDQQVFADFQLASAIVSLVGATKKTR